MTKSKEPKIIEFPAPKVTSANTTDMTLPRPDPQTQGLPTSAFMPSLHTVIADEIARILYRVATQLDDVEIVTMTEEEFRLFCRKVAEEDA